VTIGPAAAGSADAAVTLPYRTAFERLAAGDGAGAWLLPLRREAIERFEMMGFPTFRHEAWRYTSVAALARVPFETAPRAKVTPGALAALLDDDGDAARVVFVNGHHEPALSRPRAGLSVAPLSAALGRPDGDLRELLARVAGPGDNPFTELNTALFSDGALLRVPRGTVLEAPVHVVFVSAPGGSGAPAVSYPRCLIVAEPGSQAVVVESHVGLEGSAGLTSAVTEIDVREGAVLQHIRIQREAVGATHIGALHARVGRQATWASHSLALGARLSRVEVRALLAAEGADVTLNGLYALKGSQHADHHTLVDHAAPHGTSRQLYKGVLDEASRGVFDGTVIVRPDAQKTDARQENRNLILSADALVDTKPTLMINADDVKCSHAATIGQMDETSLFYLRSRALGVEDARRLLIRAFIVDVLQRLPVAPLRDALEKALA
jgi:Fe-S cluster assembly protein SufD